MGDSDIPFPPPKQDSIPIILPPPTSTTNQRIITVQEIVPPLERVYTAWNEQALGDHLEKYLQADDNSQRTFVFSSVFGGCHLYCYAPSQKLARNYWTIVTMGLSGTKMNVPTDIPDGHEYDRAELLCYLPPDWSFPVSLGNRIINEQNWPLEMLREFVRYVRDTKAWIADCHGLPIMLSEEEPGKPFLSNVPFTHVILFEPVNEDPGFLSVEIDGARVNFYSVIPLTAAEAAWKREVGAARSLYHVVGSKEIGGDNVIIDYIIDPNRKCAVEFHGQRELLAQYYANHHSSDSEDAGDDADVDEEEQDKEGAEGGR